MGIKKFQKVWSDFCTAPQVQLAKMYEGQCFENGYYSRKLDGVRCYIKNGIMYTRTNKPQKRDPIKHIVEQIKEIPDSEKFVFDGELIYIEPNTLYEDFKKTVSLVRSDDKKDDCSDIYFVIFDIIPLECFENKVPYVAFKDEYKMLGLDFSMGKAMLNFIERRNVYDTYASEKLEEQLLKRFRFVKNEGNFTEEYDYFVDLNGYFDVNCHV